MNSHKIAKFAKVSPLKVSHYTVFYRHSVYGLASKYGGCIEFKIMSRASEDNSTYLRIKGIISSSRKVDFNNQVKLKVIMDVVRVA